MEGKDTGNEGRVSKGRSRTALSRILPIRVHT